MVRAKLSLPHRLLLFSALFALVLMNMVGKQAVAQDESETCPCFSDEEVESIIQRGEQLAMEEGEFSCSTQDYTVELNAEVMIMDQDYATVAQARVDWYDFDPGRCQYIDVEGNPGAERNVRWPHPAPEATARACFDIISSVIAKSDTSGRCNTYP